MHSSQFKTASDHTGKTLVVVGTGASGHDICADCVEHDVGEFRDFNSKAS